MDVQASPEVANFDKPKYWDLFDPGSIFEAKDFDILIKFLNCRGTKEVEFNMTATELTIVVKGSPENEDTSCILYHEELTKISRPRRQDVVDMILSHPGISKIEKDRMGDTLAAYFNV